MNIIITIVVPVYKVEKYLNKCIESIINQTYRFLEIILINDGSPDGCPEMCDNYAKNDSRIRVIHKLNGGLSEARNFGLRAAIGEYILFVDSDDYIELDTCQKFIEIINCSKVDIIVGNGKRIEDSRITPMHHKSTPQGGMMTGMEFLKAEMNAQSMHMVAWMNLYNRNFLIKNYLEFKVGMLHEDEQFTPRAFLKAQKVISTNIVFYNYIIRKDSITKKKDLTENGVHIVKICYELAEIYNKIKDNELRRLMNDNLVKKYLHGFKMGRLYRKGYTNLINKKFLLKRAHNKKNKAHAYLFFINKRLYYMVYKLTKLKALLG